MFPTIPRDAAVGFIKVLPVPRHPVHPSSIHLTTKECCPALYQPVSSRKSICMSSILMYVMMHVSPSIQQAVHLVWQLVKTRHHMQNLSSDFLVPCVL